MDYGMKGKVALVTGATSGIGRETALIFAREGAKVVCSGRNEERGAETVQMIKDEGGEAVFFKADITVEEQVKALVDFAVATYGGIDYAVNNAGVAVGAGGPLHTVDQAKFDLALGVNLYGVLYCMRYELAVMDAAGKGAIVNTASINAIRATRFGTPYTTSKYAVYGLTRAAALDYAEKGIRINAVGPGVTDTPMIAALKKLVPEKMQGLINTIPDKKMGTAENQANMIVYLCSDLASHITAELVVVDGGQNANM